MPFHCSLVPCCLDPCSYRGILVSHHRITRYGPGVSPLDPSWLVSLESGVFVQCQSGMLTLQRQLLLLFCQFFRKYLTPEERADVLMVSMEAMTSANRKDAFAASKMLKMILKYSMPEIGKVPALRGLIFKVNWRFFLSVWDLVLFYFLLVGV